MSIISTLVAFYIIYKGGKWIIHLTKGYVHPIPWTNTQSLGVIGPLKFFPLRGKGSLYDDCLNLSSKKFMIVAETECSTYVFEASFSSLDT